MSKNFRLPRDRVTINEETLRDGEQTAGVNFLAEDKVMIAQSIAATLPGCIINAGYPSVSEAEFAAVQAVARNVTGAQVECAGHARRDHLARCYQAVRDAEMPRVAFWFPTSQLMLDSRLGRTPAEMLAEALDLLAYGRDLFGDNVGIDVALNDASRAAPDFLLEVCTRLTEAGADLLVICDSSGTLLPHEVATLLGPLTNALPQADFCFHGHNDLGNGTANAIAAIRAGAGAVAATMNGLGDQMMAPTEEIIANLLLRSDGIGRTIVADSKRLLPLSRLVAGLSNIRPGAVKPISGASVLRRETGTHVDWILREPRSFATVTPDFLGVAEIEFVIGKHSSHGSISAALTQRGITLTHDEIHALFVAVKELTGRQRQISEKELAQLIEAACGRAAA